METVKTSSGGSETWWKTVTVGLITIAIASFFMYIWTRRRLWHLAAKLPGPTPIPLLGNLLTFAGCDLIKFFQRLMELVDKHGTIVKLWLGQDLFVLVSDPVALEKILGNKQFIKRTGYVTKLGKPFFRNGLLMSDGETWRIHRKIISSTFHNNVLDQFVANFSKNSNILVDRMKSLSDGTAFDIYPLISLCTLDVICETAMGKTVNAQLNYDGEYVKHVLRSLQLLAERFMRPWLSIDWLFNMTELGKEQAATLKYLHGHAEQVVAEKMEKYKSSGKQKTQVEDIQSLRRKKLSLLDLLIEDEQLTSDEIHDEVVTIVAAGSETTATTCCYVLALLGVYQEIQEKVIEEQRSVFGDDFQRPVIKEAMRLFPPIPYLFRMIEKETDLGNGYVLPAGCYSMVISYTTHRNPEYFPDPERFDPDRFTPENCLGRHPYAYIPFGAGRRMYIISIDSMLAPYWGVLLSYVTIWRIFLLVTAVITIHLSIFWWRNRFYWQIGSKLPGPQTFPLLGNIHLFLGKTTVQYFNLVKQLHNEFGSIFRIWAGPMLFVLISNPDSAEKVIGDKRFENRGWYLYQVGKPIFNNGLIVSRGETWRSHRKIVSSAFHMKILEEFVCNFGKNANILVKQLLNKATGTTFDVYPYLFNCTLDIIVETTAGISINAQTDTSSPYTIYLSKLSELLFQRFQKWWFMFNFLDNLTAQGREKRAILNSINKVIYDTIEEKLDNFIELKNQESEAILRKKEKAFTDMMLEEKSLTKEDLRDETFTIVAAGSETTATTTSYVLVMLGIHQDIQEKIIEEQNNIFHDDYHRSVTAADLKDMLYLEQVVKETMRLFPSLPYIFRSISRNLELCKGYEAPRGTLCVVNCVNLHRNSKYFPDPERFCPERFSPENSVGRHPYAFLPFGGGRRNCVGNQYAMMEMKTLLSTILRQYQVTYVPGGREGLERRLEAGLVVKPHGGFPIQLMPRHCF
ncbi:hypothetical protein C0J52_18783 [Blattella germanica]|nr:hypothetical protein C0J52_18783 [Blattella germanica]